MTYPTVEGTQLPVLQDTSDDRVVQCFGASSGTSTSPIGRAAFSTTNGPGEREGLLLAEVARPRERNERVDARDRDGLQQRGRRDSGDSAPAGETGAGAVTDTADSGGAADSGDAAPLVCADGLNPAPLDHLTCANQSLCRWPGTQTSGSLGYAIDVGGDVNGDGWADLLVGAPAEDQMRDDVVVGTDSGGVHLWLNPGQGDATTPTASLFGETAGAFMGTAVAIIPDVNGDGLDDILAGAADSTATASSAAAAPSWCSVRPTGSTVPRGRADLARRGELSRGRP